MAKVTRNLRKTNAQVARDMQAPQADDAVAESSKTQDQPAADAADAVPEFDPKAFLQTVTELPGVYRMYSKTGDIIYVGKAKNLKNRLSSYFQKNVDHPKTRVLVAQIANVQYTVTGNASEALILEHNLIKEHRPRYNVLLRDDKSYPYIFISTRDDYPRISYQRGSRKAKGKYIGPYPNAWAIKRALRLVQRLFQVRQCEDSYFRNRSRPCLQHQIRRCTAPCVNLISPEAYKRDVDLTIKLLEGKDREIIEKLTGEMDTASEQLNFERAATLRDQIANLKRIGDLGVTMREDGSVDYVAALTAGGQSCVQVFHVRNGVNLGNNAFYPASPEGSSNADILSAFVTQFYLEHEVPREIILSEAIEEVDVVQDVLSTRAGVAVTLSHKVRGERARMQTLSVTNAEIGLNTRLTSRSGAAARLDALRKVVGLDELPQRMECFDISHTMGESTVASCVVFNAEGPLKAEYRRFNIENITPGDDYAAMRQALQRRYTRMLKEGRALPDILFIDGGKGQLSMAQEVMRELQISEVTLVGVAKGPDRRAGDETLLITRQDPNAVPGETRDEPDDTDDTETRRTGNPVAVAMREDPPLQLGIDSPALMLVQQIRDEAHRFAITGHRGKRAKARRQSVLEEIRGLGPKRRKVLLTHFGGLQGIANAGKDDIAAVPGIGADLAELVFDTLHSKRSKG